MTLRLLGLIALLPLAATAAEPRAFTTVAVLQDEAALNGAHDVELQGELAFVPGKGGSLAIINIADPARPQIVWSRRDVDFLGDAETVLPAGDFLLLGTQDFHTLDVRNPSQPVFAAMIKDRPTIDRINGFVRRGDIVFAANKSGYLDAFDVSDPARPKLFGALNVRERDDVGDPHDVDLLGDLAVVVDPNGFGRRPVPGRVGVYRVVDGATGDVLPAEQWKLVGQVADDRLVGGNRIRTRGEFAFVAASITPEAPNRDELQPCVAVIDLTDPAGGKVVATVPFPDVRGPNGMDVAGGVVFASGGQSVMAVDVRDPRNPKLLAAEKCLDVFHGDAGRDDGHDLEYRNGYLYVSGQTSHTFGVLRVDDARIREVAEMRSPDA